MTTEQERRACTYHRESLHTARTQIQEVARRHRRLRQTTVPLLDRALEVMSACEGSDIGRRLQGIIQHCYAMYSLEAHTFCTIYAGPISRYDTGLGDSLEQDIVSNGCAKSCENKAHDFKEVFILCDTVYCCQLL